MPDPKVNSLFVKYRYYLPVAVLFSVSLVFIGLTLNFGYKYLELRSDLKSEEEAFDKLNETLSTLEKLSLEGLDVEQSLAESALPPEKPIFEVLTNLNRLASSSGIALRELSSKPGSLASESAVTGRSVRTVSRGDKTVRPDSFTLTVSIEGSYDNMRNFFLKVNDLLPIIALNEVRITSRDEDRFNSEVDFLVYWKAREEVSLEKAVNVEYRPFSREQEEMLQLLSVQTTQN